MVLLLWCQSVPNCLPALQFLPLRWRKIPVPVVVLEDPLLFLRCQIAEFSLRLRRRVRGRRAVRIVVRIRARPRHGIRPVRAVSLRIPPATVRPVPLLRGFRRILRWLVLLLLLWPRLSFRRIVLRRKIRAPVLRHRRAGQ